LVCRVESWILHGVPRVEEGCGTLHYTSMTEVQKFSTEILEAPHNYNIGRITYFNGDVIEK
jgi:hypothetical protein